MSGWLERAKLWAAPAMVGALLLLALVVLSRFHHAAALFVAFTVAAAVGWALIIERK